MAPFGTCQFVILRYPERWFSKESVNLYTKASGSNVNWAFSVKSVEIPSNNWSWEEGNKELGELIL